MAAQRYRVEVSPDLLRFSRALHRVSRFRERCNGHNYQMSVRVDAALGSDGYVLDFGVVKRAAEALLRSSPGEPSCRCAATAS
jgi:6-pyruvoyltetrahydropterin/6-carboxytetrahydropterin synthase